MKGQLQPGLFVSRLFLSVCGEFIPVLCGNSVSKNCFAPLPLQSCSGILKNAPSTNIFVQFKSCCIPEMHRHEQDFFPVKQKNWLQLRWFGKQNTSYLDRSDRCVFPSCLLTTGIVLRNLLEKKKIFSSFCIGCV